jgi:hypothetical protein
VARARFCGKYPRPFVTVWELALALDDWGTETDIIETESALPDLGAGSNEDDSDKVTTIASRRNGHKVTAVINPCRMHPTVN